MVTAKQLAARRRFAAAARRGRIRKGAKLRRASATRRVLRRKAKRTTRRRARKTAAKKTKKVRHTKKTKTVPVISLLLGLALVDKATNGVLQNLSSGNLAAAGTNFRATLQDPKTAIKNAMPYAVGLAGVATAKKFVGNPGVKIGPVRLTA